MEREKPPCDFGCGEKGTEERRWDDTGKDKTEEREGGSWCLCRGCAREYDKENTPPKLENGFYVGAHFEEKGSCPHTTVPYIWVGDTDPSHPNSPYCDDYALVPRNGVIVITEVPTYECLHDSSSSSVCTFRVFPTEEEAKESFNTPKEENEEHGFYRPTEVMLTCTQLEQIFENGGVINL